MTELLCDNIIETILHYLPLSSIIFNNEETARIKQMNELK